MDKTLMPLQEDESHVLLYKEDYLLFGLLIRHELIKTSDHDQLVRIQKEDPRRPTLMKLLCETSETPEKTEKDLQELLDILSNKKLAEFLPDSVKNLETVMKLDGATIAGTLSDQPATSARTEVSASMAETASVSSLETHSDSTISLESLNHETKSRITDDEMNLLKQSRAKGGLIGQVLANHLVLDRIGAGAQGEVYLAKQLSLNRYVALKRLGVPQGSSTTEFIKAFRTEAELLASVNHSNIVDVYEIFQMNNEVFYTMECIEGYPITQLVKDNPKGLSLDIVANIACQAASALQRTAEDQLVHRDLKPANILLNNNGDVKIVDFGLAGVAAAMEGAMGFAGTPAYAAPEQFSGGEITDRTDQYSLGITLYELVTGELPFKAKRMKEIMELHLSGKPTPPSQINELLPRSVDQVILKMMEKDPQKRFGNFHEVYEAWERVLAKESGRSTSGAGKLLGEALLKFGREQKGKLLKQTAILTGCWALLAIGAVIGEVGLRKNSYHGLVKDVGTWGTYILVFSLLCVFYVALARRRILPVWGNLKVWLYTHIVTVIPAIVLLLIHSGNFMRGITPGPPQSKPLLSILLSTSLLIAAISGSLGLLIFRALRRRIELEKLNLRGTGDLDARQDMMLTLSAQLLSGWRLVHYPIAILFILLTVLHIFISIKYQITGA